MVLRMCNIRGILRIVVYVNTRNTIHCKTPRPFLFDKVICEHFYELVITIAL